MQHVLDTGKRVFSAAIAAATIAFSIGAAALVSPVTAQAVSAGDLIKGTSLTTVYYKGYDGLRYAFPNEKTYFSWYADFDDVVTISDTELASYTLGGNIVVRPGTHFVKVTSDAKTYAVGRDGMLHWLESEQVAIDLAGSDWASNVIDIPDVFFDDYTVGTSLMTASAFEGAVYEMGGVTYISWDGEMREVTSSGMTANNIWDKFVLDGSDIDDSSLTMGADITGEILALVDAAQTEDGESAVTGDIEISEASSMPAGASVTGGANGVEVFSFDVEAGSDDATLDSVVLTMIGAGSTDNLEDVYLYEGDTRLTDARSVNASTRQVTFSNLGIEVGAGDERTITARVTFATIAGAATAADTVGFEISDEADVTASGDVDGSFPVEGNIFTMTGSDSGTITIDANGTVSDPTLGEQDAEIGRFSLLPDDEDADVEAVTLKIDNASDHDGYTLWNGDEMLVDGEVTDGDSVLFDLSDEPFFIEDGDTEIFTVTADIGGEADDSVEVYVDNEVDIIATGRDYGYGMSVDITGYDGGDQGDGDSETCSSSTDDCTYSAIQGGDITLAFNGPSASDIQIDSQDQTLLAFSITAAQDVTVKDFDVVIASSTSDLTESSAANLTDIKIVNADTGAVLMGPEELSGAGSTSSQTVSFTDDFSLDAGETIDLEVRVDVESATDASAIFTATFDTSTLTVEDTNGDEISSSDIVPASDLTGYNQTARAASLTFALASTPTDTTTVDGTDGVNAVSFSVSAGDASDITITDFTLSAYGSEAGTTFVLGGGTDQDSDSTVEADVNEHVESCSLYDADDVLLAGPESPSSDGTTLRFDDIDWTVTAGEVQTMKVECNFANTTVSGSSYFAFDINTASTDITAEDEDGDSVTATGSDINGATTSTNVVTLADNGSLAVTVGSGSPSADFVLTSSSSNHVATYRFTAANESFNVETLTFSEEQAEDDLATTDSSGYANNISLVTIEYPKADGTTGTKSVAMSGNEAKFSALDMFVEVGDPADVEVMVNVPLSERDSGGSATSNEKIRMGLFVDTTNDDNFKAVGEGSGATLDDDDQSTAIGDDSAATDGVHTFVVKEAKPTVSLSSLSPSGSAVVGRSEVLRFNVAASSNEDVVLSRMIFKMSSTDGNGDDLVDWNDCDTDDPALAMDPSDFDFYNLTDDGTTTTLDLSSSDTHNTTLAHMQAATNNPWTFLTATGALCSATTATTGFIALRLPTTEIIPAGETKTFALYYDSTGASASSDDSVRFDLPSDPIASSYLAVTDASAEAGAWAATDTTLDVDAGTSFAIGDVLVFDVGDDGLTSTDERLLVTAISSNALSVVRGYLGTNLTTAASAGASDDVLRLPGSFLWKDDGVTGHTGTTDDFWGSYLVDNLTVSGGTLVF